MNEMGCNISTIEKENIDNNEIEKKINEEIDNKEVNINQSILMIRENSMNYNNTLIEILNNKLYDKTIPKFVVYPLETSTMNIVTSTSFINLLYVASLIYRNAMMKEYLRFNYVIDFNSVCRSYNMFNIEQLFELLCDVEIEAFCINRELFIKLSEMNENVNNKNVNSFLKSEKNKGKIYSTLCNGYIDKDFYRLLKYVDQDEIDRNIMYILIDDINNDMNLLKYVDNVNILIDDLNFLFLSIVKYITERKQETFDLIKILIDKDATLLLLNLEQHVENKPQFTKDLLLLLEPLENFHDFIQMNRDYIIRNSDDETLKYLLSII